MNAPRPRKVRLDELPGETPRSGVTRRRMTGERLELIAYRYEPGTTFPRHAHPAEQLTLVQAGALVFVFDDGETHLAAGEVLSIPGGIAHAAYVPEDAPGPTETLNVFTPVRAKGAQARQCASPTSPRWACASALVPLDK
ncbi:MAG: cupin domain-containing protein [Trueperaceae bacterium]|nr:cupin domain-containing protein [Trueperaceae bacterium]